MKVGILVAGLLFCITRAFGLVAPQGLSAPSQTSLDRKVELMVRDKFGIPSNCDVTVGGRTPSSIPGYDTLRITVANGKASTQVDFLISSDNKNLARFEKFDLDSNPALLIDVRNRPVRGNPHAPVTVISFDDLECPACAYVHQQLFPAALDRYGDRVRFIYKDNPLTEIHPWALHAAVDATCLADQGAGAYWSYVDYVHSHVEEVSGPSRDLPKSFSKLDSIASAAGKSAGLDSEKLQACLKTQDDAPVRQSMREAGALGLNFTPALFVNGEEVRGMRSIDDVWTVIDRALRESGASGPEQPLQKK